jgi:hypothetical protein
MTSIGFGPEAQTFIGRQPKAAAGGQPLFSVTVIPAQLRERQRCPKCNIFNLFALRLIAVSRQVRTRWRALCGELQRVSRPRGPYRCATGGGIGDQPCNAFRTHPHATWRSSTAAAKISSKRSHRGVAGACRGLWGSTVTPGRLAGAPGCVGGYGSGLRTETAKVATSKAKD